MSAADDPNQPPPLPARPIPWLVIVLLLALVLVPLFVWEWPEEQLRWKVARAVEARLQGNKDEALTAIDEILRDNPKNVAVLLLRVQWQIEDGQGDRALADVETAYEATGRRGLLLARNGVGTAVGRYAEAARDADTLLKDIGTNRPDRRANMLNLAAYTRAIGNIELKRALEQANEALKLATEEQHIALYDTRGFIYYRLKRYPEALTDLDLAIREVDAEFAAWKAAHPHEAFRPENADFSTRFNFRGWSVIYYHRGLVYQALENTEKAEADFKQVREWGFEPIEELY
jgi:tetratricopeptide (TPR) repeat protein